MATYTLPNPGDTNWGPEMATALAAINTDVESRAEDTAVMHNTGAETVGGVKTFTDGIVIPDADLPISAVSGLQDALNTSGGVKTVNTLTPDGSGNVSLTFTAADVGALSSTSTLDDIPDGTTNVGYTATEKTKLAGLPDAPFATVKFAPYATTSALPSASTSGAGSVAFVTGEGLVYSDGTSWFKVVDGTAA